MKDYTTILEWSDEEIWEEISAIQYLYRLKAVTRWGLDRKEEFKSETVAEHVYGMMTLAEYFLPLEDPQQALDHKKILELIIWHDADEIESGDIVTYKKSDASLVQAQSDLQIAIQKAPELIRDKFESLVLEYEAQQTPESRFVKALDKIEPEFEIANEEGRKKLVEYMKFTKAEFHKVQDSLTSYIKDYKYLVRFHESIKRFRQENDYHLYE